MQRLCDGRRGFRQSEGALVEYEKHFESMDDIVEIDPDRPSIISAFGRKGSGKSTWISALYDSYPYDKLAIDVNGDIDTGATPAILISDPLPDYFPVFSDAEPKNLHYIASQKSPTYREDLNQAISMALFPQDKKVLVNLDEIGEFCTGNYSGPNLRLLLMQSRHYRVTALLAGPRPMDIDPLIIGQSDMIAIYEMPNPADQKRVADIIGYPAARFTEAMNEIKRLGPYYHLLFVGGDMSKTGRAELAICDPIELD